MKGQHRGERGAVSGVVLAVGALAVLAAGVGLWWFLSGDEPAAVDLESAASVVSTSIPAPSATSDGTPGPEPGAGMDGTWTVDTSIGSFSFEDASSSFVGFRVAEELASIGASEAVGRTPEVTGTMEIEGTTLLAANIEADFTAIVSNDDRRDNKIQGALETSQFPTATFVLTEPVDFGAIPEDGETISVTAIGELTVHGISNTIEMPLQAQLIGDVIVVVGSTEIVFADYNVEAPSAVIVLSVEDRGQVELQLFFSR
ncbi:MAG: YceI family protein [Acidimicrobiia bacterium]|nr:YceI family protein [Acidimicrobiia bacterium]MDH5615914.1 YceI family protein [Acidimicrobiia bacterium]